jgi:hypothetical protein
MEKLPEAVIVIDSQVEKMLLRKREKWESLLSL